MGVIFKETLYDIVFIISFIFVCVYLYMQYLFTYWKRKNVPYCTPSFPFGNMYPVLSLQKYVGVHIIDLYNKVNERYFGIYVLGKPTLVIKDIDLVKAVMVKDYSHFQGRGVHADENVDPLSANLFGLSGEKWKIRRTAMSPAFSSSKLKIVLNTVIKCGNELEKHLYTKVNEEIDMRDLAARYTTDIVASVAMGINVNSIMDPEHEFRKMGRRIFKLNFFQNIIQVLTFISPDILTKYNLRFTKPDVEKFIKNIVTHVVEHRENNNIIRNDYMQLLLQLRNSGKVNEDDTMALKVSAEKKFSLDEITAECYIFFIASFESTSITMSLTLYELALNPDIRKKVQEEIDVQVTQHNGFSYDAMIGMKYLDAVVKETMRKYPALGFLPRQCTRDYKIPDSNVVIKKGTAIVVPLWALHIDPKYFPNPDKYDPDRFREDVQPTWPPYAYMPFGEGPRACIGTRLGMMQIKIGLSKMLQKFDFIPSSRTPTKFTADVKTFGVSQEGGMFLKVIHRQY